MKKKVALVLALVIVLSCLMLTACGKKKSEVQKIIDQAQTMTLEELALKAYEESNGKTFSAVGNSSRGKTALPFFIEYVNEVAKKNGKGEYKLEYAWQQPKNNTIFEMLDTDAKKAQGEFSMTLIQDGNQIESKMVQTGILDTFIPKEWAEANKTTVEKYKGYLALQTLNKVFMFNSTGDKKYDNVWDFVAEGEHGLFMDIDSEIVGRNFLYMLTKDEYANNLKEAYDALDAKDKAYVDKAVTAVEAKAKELKLGDNGKYALAWIKLWVESYSAQTDDGPICNMLVDKSAKDQFGLLVYSKLRSVTESDSVSKNNVKVAAYEDGYKGLGGYGYCHYLFVTDNSPLPWTACAFIAYMTCTQKGFEAWGKDIGGYSSNPVVAAENDKAHPDHVTGEKDGTVYDVLKDRGFGWWEGRLAIEDPEYCAKVAYTVGSWIDTLKKYGK